MARSAFTRSLLWLLAFLLSASIAAAQGHKAARDCNEDPSCVRLIDQAYEASQQGRYDDAQRSYEQAYKLVPDPKLLYNVARVLHKAGRAAVAATYYQRFLDASGGGDDPQRRKAEQYLAQARMEAASPSAEGQKTKKPLYRQWWLWTTVGVVVVGVALGAGIGAAARQPEISNAIMVKF